MTLLTIDFVDFLAVINRFCFFFSIQSMILSFRVHELSALLSFAGRNKSGRKDELQKRALELLRLKSHPVALKIRNLYSSIQ